MIFRCCLPGLLWLKQRFDQALHASALVTYKAFLLSALLYGCQPCQRTGMSFLLISQDRPRLVGHRHALMYLNAWLHFSEFSLSYHSVSEMIWIKVETEKLQTFPGFEPGTTRITSEYQTSTPTRRCRMRKIKFRYFKRRRNELHFDFIRVS